MEPPDPEEPLTWRFYVAEELGSVKEMARSNRERLTKVEDEVGVDPPNADGKVERKIEEIEEKLEEGLQSEAGFIAALTPKSSRTRDVVAWVVVAVVITLCLIALASYEVPIPLIGSKWALLLAPRFWCKYEVGQCYRCNKQQPENDWMWYWRRDLRLLRRLGRKWIA